MLLYLLSSNDVSFIPLFSSLLFKPHSNMLSHDFWVLVGNAFNSAVVNCLTLTFMGTAAVCAFLWWKFGPPSRWANYKVVTCDLVDQIVLFYPESASFFAETSLPLPLSLLLQSEIDATKKFQILQQHYVASRLFYPPCRPLSLPTLSTEGYHFCSLYSFYSSLLHL